MTSEKTFELWDTRHGLMTPGKARDLYMEEWRGVFDRLMGEHNALPEHLLSALREFADEEGQFVADLKRSL